MLRVQYGIGYVFYTAAHTHTKYIIEVARITIPPKCSCNTQNQTIYKTNHVMKIFFPIEKKSRRRSRGWGGVV